MLTQFYIKQVVTGYMSRFAAGGACRENVSALLLRTPMRTVENSWNLFWFFDI
jgi:hypothetical protein